MAIKAIAEANKSTTSKNNISKSKSARPQISAKSQEASSNLNVLMSRNENSSESVNGDSLSYLVGPSKKAPPKNQSIQAKLTIGAPNDHLEQEADKVADNVISLSNQPKQTSQQPSADTASSGNSSSSNVNLKAESSAKPQISKVEKISTNKEKLSRVEEEEEELQTKSLVQRSFMDISDDALDFGSSSVLTQLIQTKSDGESNASASFESSLNTSKGSGSPLPSETRNEMESGIGANFSNVRVHTGSNAVQMSQDINAKAFTHGSDIYFNQGQYNPQSTGGRHLIAHELTHTVQQGASPQSSADVSRAPLDKTQPKVQRGWLGDAWDSVAGAASAAVEWAADQLNQALDWAKEQFSDFVQGIPGYKLVSVILGQDPITSAPVARNGRNFIEAGLDIIPFGGMFQRKLEESGAMEEAATWLDTQMANVDISLSAILNSMRRFWDSLSITDLGDIPGVLNRAANIVRPPVQKVINFASSIASKLLEIVKNAVLNSLVNFIKDHTRGYPLLTVILGKDPITEELVERNGMNLIRGFMLLSESGEEQLRQMEESGSLQRAADWIDGAVARLDLSWEAIKNMFSRAWDLVSIESLMNPIAAFQELANIFLEPAGRIIRFVIEVGIKILQLIKDALISRLVAYARTVRGYPLLTVLLGRDPFSGDTVIRNTENIVHGFMSLKEGGEEQFQEMKSSGAIARLSARVDAAVERLNFTWDYIRGLFTTAWESFSLSDLAAPLDAFARLLGIFGDPLMRLIAFVWEIVKIVVEVLLMMMNFPFDLINNIIARAMEAIEDIKRDPIGFLKNLIRAIKTGFVQFFDNILTHLLNGVTDWLFGQLGDAGITPPPDLSFGSILGLVLEVLGITVDRIWQKLADRIGQEKVDRVRAMIDRLTGIWTFVKDVMERGVVAIWEYIQERLTNLWDTVLDAIKNWIVTRIIQQVTAKLLSMLDPTGIMAVINGAIAFYNAIQSFIQYLRELLEIVNSFVVGVAEIAKGDVSRAANFLEGALAQGVPVAIGFLANQVGLGGLGRRIGEMIGNVREMVDQGLDWLVDKAVTTGQNILNRLTGNNQDENELEQDDSDEGRKRRAARDVEAAMAGGIKRSDLVTLLAQKKTEYRLREATLDAQDDVVLVNSPPLKIRGQRQLNAQPTTPATAPASGSAAAATSAPGTTPVSMGNVSYVAESVQTIRGALSSRISPSRWAPSNLPDSAPRPRSVEATITGGIGSDLTTASRDSDMTRLVGYFGNWESGIRKGNQSWSQQAYDGGHIIGHQFGGGETYDNLVPQQNNFLNRQGGMWATMENFIRDNLTPLTANQASQVQNPEAHIVARFTYPGSTRNVLWRVAKVAASAFYSTGGGDAEWSDFVNSMPEEGNDPQGIRTTRISVPARIPTSLTVDVTLQALVSQFDASRHTDTHTRGGNEIVSGDVSDPLIVPTDSPVVAPSGATGATASNANATPGTPQPQHWRRQFSFTQSNQA